MESGLVQVASEDHLCLVRRDILCQVEGAYLVPRSCQGEDGIMVVFLAVVVLWGHIHQELVRHPCVSVSKETCAVAHAIGGRKMQTFGESHTTHRQNRKTH